MLSAAVSAYVNDRADRGEIGPNTAKQLRVRLATLVAVCPAGLLVINVDREVIRRWQRAIGHHREATRRAYQSTARVFFGWAVERELIGEDPTEGLGRVREPHHEPRALSSAAVGRLLLVLPDRRARLIVELMVGCGLRCVEIARLEVNDFDAAARTIVVRGKGADERTLPVPDGIDLAGLPVGLSAGRVSALVSGWMRDAGIKRRSWDRVSAHALRHTFASNTLDRCGNVRTVQACLGHANVATTDRYLRPATIEQMRAAMGGGDAA
jgi:site-specific recombinase XerD